MKTMRIWFGCITGLAVSMVFGWPYGFFAVLLPLFVLTRIDHWHIGLLIQLLLGIVFVSIQVTFIINLLQPYPSLMIIAVGILLLFKCIAMNHKSTYLYGYIGLLIGSILLNFASYNNFDIEDFIVNLWMCALITAPISALALYLFPEPEQVPPAHAMTVNEQRKDKIGMMRQTALGWIVAMFAFLIFQTLDLIDSLSAQASIFIVLTPMTLIGSLGVAKVRILGTFLGCCAAMAIQLVLYSWYDNGLLFWMAFSIAAGLICPWLVQGTIKSSIAFSAMSALSVPLTTSIIPEQKDAFFSILYRFSSILVAVIATSLVIWLVHHLLVHVIRSDSMHFDESSTL